MRRFVFFLLTVLLVLGTMGCIQRQEEQEGYMLYFPTAGETEYAPAIGTQRYEGRNPQVDDLMRSLLEGPTGEMLTSPFPKGVSVIDWSLEERTGILTLTLSEQYSGLADVSLTMADYCIVLTLCQLDGVEGVEIHSIGDSASYRSHAVLRPNEIELAPSAANGA